LLENIQHRRLLPARLTPSNASIACRAEAICFWLADLTARIEAAVMFVNLEEKKE
jgi:hypothetical protein